MASSDNASLYQSCEPVVDAEYDRTTPDSTTSAIVDAIATANGVEPTELDPLYQSVDLDALERLIRSSAGRGDSVSVFSFSHGNWNVYVRSDGRIRVCDDTQPVEPAPVFDESV